MAGEGVGARGRGSGILKLEFLREWRGEHLRAPGWYYGSAGQGWDALEKYIREQNRYEYGREK